MSDNNFQRDEAEVCEFCKASAFTECSADCPCNYESFGRNLPDPLRSVITTELIKQAEFIFEKKQMDWYGKMLTERIESIMKDWPMFMDFIKILNRLEYFDTPKNVIDYLEKPREREKIFVLWQEMGMPITEGTKSYDLFRQAAGNMKEEAKKNGRAGQET